MQGESQIIWGMVFGAIGFGYFVYGKKQKAVVPLFVGIALFIVPYFLSNLYILVIVCTALVVLPYFLRI
ncbi:MAG TPA: hypothetical protein ENI74_07185 [Gammaproteobacteria bacterium]|nr:hypothetical protein [Gammaproteobacteria bacterium]